MEMNFSHEFLKKNAHELEMKSNEWNKTVDEIQRLSEKTKYSEDLKPEIKKLFYAGSVIKEYADLLQYVTDEYDKNEKSLIHKFEV